MNTQRKRFPVCAEGECSQAVNAGHAHSPSTGSVPRLLPLLAKTNRIGRAAGGGAWPSVRHGQEEPVPGERPLPAMGSRPLRAPHSGRGDYFQDICDFEALEISDFIC